MTGRRELHDHLRLSDEQASDLAPGSRAYELELCVQSLLLEAMFNRPAEYFAAVLGALRMGRPAPSKPGEGGE